MGNSMGNVIIALDDEDEKLLRSTAKRKFEGKKGSISRVVSEALHKYISGDERETRLKKFMDTLGKGVNLGGYKMYKHRDEIYDD